MSDRLPSLGANIPAPSAGTLLYSNGTDWVMLSPDADGMILVCKGGAPPQWMDLPTATDSVRGMMSASDHALLMQLATAYVPKTRTIATTAPLTGGGALTADLTLAIAPASTVGSLLRWDGSAWVATAPAGATADGSTSSPTTTSATFVLMPEMTATLTTRGGPLFVSFDGAFAITATLVLGDSVEFALFLDGVEIVGTRRTNSIALGLTINTIVTLSTQALVLTGVPSGSHTITCQWRRPGATGAARCSGTQRQLRVKELA